MLTTEQISELQKIADQNEGHCDRCHRIIKIYKYRANKQMAFVLRKMSDVVSAQEGKNEVNFNEIDIAYRLLSQRTKMRLHGLIAKVKNSDGQHVANTWLITHKGWGWLKGEQIPQTVVVFDNQVIGHDGGLITINRASGEMVVEETPVNTAEAETYHDVRQPNKRMEVTAEYKGMSIGGVVEKGGVYVLMLDRLQTGKPIKISEVCLPQSYDPLKNLGTIVTYEYRDIAAFQKSWKIIKQGG